jgi:hypothetical protein
MSEAAAGLWPWLALAGLGLFHGVNPAMGWLFAVALGLQRHSERIVLLSLVPIALGHAAAVIVVLAAVLALGLMVDWMVLGRLIGLVLIAWAIWHQLYGHRRRVRVGLQAGMAGLAVWSFFMAGAHGAGLMLVPLVVPLCLAATPAQELTAGGSLPIALAALAVHTGTMLATIAIISLAVYKWLGLAFLRQGWINFDLIWTIALGLCGFVLLLA